MSEKQKSTRAVRIRRRKAAHPYAKKPRRSTKIAIPKACLCPFCRKVCFYPHRSSGCGHTICGACLRQLRGFYCLMCRRYETFEPDPKMQVLCLKQCPHELKKREQDEGWRYDIKKLEVKCEPLWGGNIVLTGVEHVESDYRLWRFLVDAVQSDATSVSSLGSWVHGWQEDLPNCEKLGFVCMQDFAPRFLPTVKIGIHGKDMTLFIL